MLGGALAAAAGSVVSQGVGLVTGIQDKFSFKSVALSALSAGVGAGVGSIAPFGNLGSKLATDVLRGVTGNVITQGIAVATGLQSKFDWTSVAVAGVAAGAIGVANRTLAGQGIGVAADRIMDSTPRDFGFYANQAVSGLAGSIAGAGTRSIIDGSDFGDNIIATLPDVIAATIGTFIGESLKSKPAAIPQAKRDDLEKLGIPTSVGLDGSVTTKLSPSEIERRVQAAKASGETVEIGRDDNIVIGVSRSASQRVSNADGDISFINYLADPDISATYESLYVGSRQTGAIRFISNAQGQTYLYDGSQTRIDGLGLSISYGTTAQRSEPAVQPSNYNFASFQPTLPSIANLFGGSSYIDRSYSWNGRDYISREAAMRDGATFINAAPARGSVSQADAELYLSRVSTPGFAGIAYGLARAFGADPAAQNLMFGLAQSADGIALARALAPRTGSVQPISNGGSSVVSRNVTSTSATVNQLAAESEALSPFTQRYLTESGGRFGGTATRQQNYAISQELKARGYTEARRPGGGLGSEEYIAGSGSNGRTYVDISAIAPNGRTVRIQTITTRADGMTPAASEAAAAARIRAAFPNDKLLLVPKRKP